MVFVIAEIGVNWDGDFDIAKDMMKKAKEFGCNAVKFQAFKKEMVKAHPENKRLEKSAISESNIKQIDNIAKTVGIEWFCTPMYPEAVDFLEPFVNKYKIRYSDGKTILNNGTSPILERILKTQKEVLISSNQPPKDLENFSDKKIKWLYCEPKYPCDFSDLDFTENKYYDGFSNHCPKIIAPLVATILGLEIIEIHITSNKDKNFIDNSVSFNYNELQQLVSLIRQSEKILR